MSEISGKTFKKIHQHFRNLITSEPPHIPVSRYEQVICDLFMAYRHKDRMVDEQNLPNVVEEWEITCWLLFSLVMRRTLAAKSFDLLERQTRANEFQDRIWVQITLNKPSSQSSFFLKGNMADFFAEIQPLDLNIFGIINKGSQTQVTSLSTEQDKHDSEPVVSQLHHYLSRLSASLGCTKQLYLHMYSCTGQKKNSITLGY